MPTLRELNIAQPQPVSAIMRAQQHQSSLEKLGMEKKRLELSEKYYGLQEEQFKHNRMKSELANGMRFLPAMTQDEYGQVKKWLESTGVPSGILPDESEVSQYDNDQWEKLKEQIVFGADYLAQSNLQQKNDLFKKLEENRKEKAKIREEQRKEQATIRKEQREEQAEIRKEGRAKKADAKESEQDTKYRQDLTNAYISIDEGMETREVFSQLRKLYPDKSKDLLAIEKAVNAVAAMPDEVQSELEVSANKINAGEADAGEESRRLGSKYPDHSKQIEAILITPRSQEDMMEIFKTVFE